MTGICGDRVTWPERSGRYTNENEDLPGNSEMIMLS
jgi:hypothetical protein